MEQSQLCQFKLHNMSDKPIEIKLYTVENANKNSDCLITGIDNYDLGKIQPHGSANFSL